MALVCRREQGAEKLKSKTQLRLRPVAVCCADCFVLALLCSTSNEYYFALWDRESHELNAKELDVKNSKFCKSIGQNKLSHLALRVVYADAEQPSSPKSSRGRGGGAPQHFIVVGGGRDQVSRWVLSASGNVLHHESEQTSDATVDHLASDEGGDFVATFERKRVVVRDACLVVCGVLRWNKETPTAGTFVYPQEEEERASGRNSTSTSTSSRRPRYFICCFESGLVAAWDLIALTDTETASSCDSQPLFLLKLSGTTSSSSSVCSLVQVEAATVPSKKKAPGGGGGGGGGREARRFCVSSREGKLWVVEWSLRDSTCCNEVNCLDLQKQMRFKSELSTAQASLDQQQAQGQSSYKLDGVATALTAPSAASAAARVESVFNVLCLCAAHASSGVRAAVFIMTTNGVLISVDIESLKVVDQVVVSEAGHGSTKVSSGKGASGSPVLLAAIAALSAPVLEAATASTAVFANATATGPGAAGAGAAGAGAGAGAGAVCGKGGRRRISALAVVLTAFDRKLYMSPGYLPCVLPAASPTVESIPLAGLAVSSVEKTPPKHQQEQQENNPKLPAWAQRAHSDNRLAIQTSPLVKRPTSLVRAATTPSPGKHVSAGGDEEDWRGQQEQEQDVALSFFRLSRSPLPPSSPLVVSQSHLPLAAPPTTGRYAGGSTAQGRGAWEQPAKRKDGALQDLPVTFHTRIKSSGYSNATARTQQLGRSISAPRSGKRVPAAAKTTDRSNVNSRIRPYPKECLPFTVHQAHNDYPPKQSNTPFTPIMNATFSPDGALLGLVTGGNAVCTLKAPLGRFKGEGHFYMGHDAQINSVEFSHKNQLIISSSDDGTARVWKPGKVDAAAVVFTHKHHSAQVGGPSPMKAGVGEAASSRASASASRNKPFAGPISKASFYYMDKFILLTTKSGVLMYTYDLHDFEAKNDLKRLQATGKYRLAHEWSPRGGEAGAGAGAQQSVTASACINSVESPIILAATSDRKLLVLDSVTGLISRNIDSGHDRNIHCIALPQPSVHVPLSQVTYNIFATAGTDNVISLWDLRTPRSTSRFTSHVNRREKCQCSFSPCMRFLAAASEDRSARIFDIRGGREVARLAGQHRDVVSSVAYHPVHPQLVTVSYDGGVRCYVGDDLAP